MSPRKALPLFLVSGILIVALSAAPRAGTAGWSAAQPGTSPTTPPHPAPKSSPAAPSANVHVCQVVSPEIDIRVEEGSGPSEYPAGIAYNPLHDEYLVVWSVTQGPLTTDIWARRVHGDGRVDNWFNVVTAEAEKRYFPDVAYSPEQDEYLVVYSHDASATGVDILGKRVRWDGGSMSDEFPVNDGANDQIGPVAAYNPEEDEYLVVYQDYGDTGPPYDIAADRLRASDGNWLSSRTIAGGTGQTRGNPAVAYNWPRDEYLVVYDFREGTSEQIRGRLVSHDMATLGTEQTICNDTVYGGYPQVAAGPDEYLAVWKQEQATFNDTDIFGRRLSGAGTPQGPGTGFAIAGEEASGEYALPNVAFTGRLGYLVGMYLTRYTPEYIPPDVLARYVMPEADAVMSELFPLFQSPVAETGALTACAPHGNCLMVTGRYDETGVDWEIWGRFLRACPRLFLPTVVKNH